MLPARSVYICGCTLYYDLCLYAYEHIIYDGSVIARWLRDPRTKRKCTNCLIRTRGEQIFGLTHELHRKRCRCCGACASPRSAPCRSAKEPYVTNDSNKQHAMKDPDISPQKSPTDTRPSQQRCDYTGFNLAALRSLKRRIEASSQVTLSLSLEAQVTCVLHPTPYTLNPTPYTLHPTPCTRHATRDTLHPKPYTLHPTPYTLHPATWTP